MTIITACKLTKRLDRIEEKTSYEYAFKKRLLLLSTSDTNVFGDFSHLFRNDFSRFKTDSGQLSRTRNSMQTLQTLQTMQTNHFVNNY